jgi:hypothetical protein
MLFFRDGNEFQTHKKLPSITNKKKLSFQFQWKRSYCFVCNTLEWGRIILTCNFSASFSFIVTGVNNSDAAFSSPFYIFMSEVRLTLWEFQSANIGCSFCRLIRRPEHFISRKTEGHSFGDHLISESVSVTPSSVTEAPIVLCSVSLWLVWVNV